MSERSKAWKQKKESLDQKERAIREELEESSTLLESRAKKVLMYSLIAGGIALLGYLTYRAFSGSDQKEDKKEGEKKGGTLAASTSKIVTPLLSAAVTERLINAGVSYLVNRLTAAKKEASEKES